MNHQDAKAQRKSMRGNGDVVFQWWEEQNKVTGDRAQVTDAEESQ